MSILSRIFGSKPRHAVTRAGRLGEVEANMVLLQRRLNKVAPGVVVRRDSTHFYAEINDCGAAITFDDLKNDFDAGSE